MEISKFRKPTGPRKQSRFLSRTKPEHRGFIRSNDFSFAAKHEPVITIAEPKAPPVQVCLLSTHPLGSHHISELLNPTCEVSTLALQNNFDPSTSEITIPQADVYIVDGYTHTMQVTASVGLVLKKHVGAKILVLLEKMSEQFVFPVLQQGVQGVLMYDNLRQHLFRSIAEIARGGYWVPRDILFRFVQKILKHNTRKGSMKATHELSRREREVTNCVLENLTNKEIANRLNISERTAKFHVSNILSKFEVQRRADLILLSYQAHST